MNAAAEPNRVNERPSRPIVRLWLGRYLSGRRGLVVLAVVATGVWLFLSWGWLAAVGLAPLLLALAPCAAMCAFGMCANKRGKSCSSHSKPGNGEREMEAS